MDTDEYSYQEDQLMEELKRELIRNLVKTLLHLN